MDGVGEEDAGDTVPFIYVVGGAKERCLMLRVYQVEGPPGDFFGSPSFHCLN